MANKGKIKCRFCGEFFDESDVNIEQQVGPLCDNCVAELESRGERPIIAHGMSYDEWIAERKDRTRRNRE